MSQASSIPQRSFETNPKSNVEIKDPASEGNKSAGENVPGFKGPGSSASKQGGIQPHSNKVMNRVDPRFDADRLQEAEKERSEVNSSSKGQ